MNRRVVTLDSTAYRTLITDSVVIEAAPWGEKVRRKSDGTIIKYFYLKRLFSSALLRPYAMRFCRNAHELQRRRINTVSCTRIYRIERTGTWLVTYPEIPGKTLRQNLRAHPESKNEIDRLPTFLAKLHEKGILFRSIHFNNILVQPRDPAFALIDITDTRFTRGSLTATKRARNMRHLIHDPEDRRSLSRYSRPRFLEAYCAAARFDENTRRNFIGRLRRHAPWLLEP